jgi:hypothetical protein
MSNLRTRIIAALTALAGLGTTACYGYYQPMASNLAGHQVQLAITDSGSVVLAPQVGFGIEALDGKLVADTASRYVVSVTGIHRRDGQESGWKGESVYVPHVLVSGLTERRFSRARTTLFAAATTIAMISMKRAFGGAGGATAPGGSTGTGGGPR